MYKSRNAEQCMHTLVLKLSTCMHMVVFERRSSACSSSYLQIHLSIFLHVCVRKIQWYKYKLVYMSKNMHVKCSAFEEKGE